MTVQAESMVSIDAAGVYYRDLNEQVRSALAGKARRVVLENVCGQRYIGCGLRDKDALIEITGTPGNDMAAFMDGPTLLVHGNAQDGVGNTMTSGRIVVHGHAGDVLAHSLRGGEIYIRGNAGYRAAIHMKQYTEPVPVVVVGGALGDYAGEYMAGGILVVLGLELGDNGDASPAIKATKGPLVGRLLGTGMHNGAIYIRGNVQDHQMGKEIGRVPIDGRDQERLAQIVGQFAKHFGLDAHAILAGPFTKFTATSARPYGKLYVY